MQPDCFQDGPILKAPDDPAAWPRWRETLHAWRAEMRRTLPHDDALYRRPECAWAASAFACGLVMLWDETFYDRAARRWKVDAFLEEGRCAFGGYDALVLWHAYPRIGVDARNQVDFYRDMPGGLDGLRDLARTLHARGVRVFLDYNPWDTGTRREGCSDAEALAGLVAAIEADGVFLDTLAQAQGLRESLAAARPGLALESELHLPPVALRDHLLSWAQFFPWDPITLDSRAPGVLRSKWLERHHMQHAIDRNATDHTAELHLAWMNGVGVLIWENVFGTLNPWSPRDRSMLRALLPVQRRFAALFASEQWTPLVPTLAAEVYASLWEAPGVRLWTLVNRAETAIEGPLLEIERTSSAERYFDLIAGRALTPVVAQDRPPLTGALRPRGVGALAALTPEAVTPEFLAWLAQQAENERRADWRTTRDIPPERAIEVAPTRIRAADALPAEMTPIPAARFRLVATHRCRECGFYRTPPLRPLMPHVGHQLSVDARDVELAPYAMDLTPVTNTQYAAFLAASGYRPTHPENFLKHWSGGRPPPGREVHPVVYVDLDDARAYARWAGKRLPREEEWQYAAQGPDQYLYPWGDDDPGHCRDHRMGGGRCHAEGPDTTSVHAYPAGRSPFGCWDMCGNVWEWTESERTDGRTRFCLLKGGSHYAARDSVWYTDGGPRPCNFGLKFLLIWPGLDRCATIGFRCAADVG